MEDVKREIDDLIRLRNIQTVTLAGGEPLLYARLDELIAYSRHCGLQVVLATNGRLLDKERLDELVRAGVSRVVAHIQGNQEEGGDSVAEAERRREDLCNLFRAVGGATFGFLLTVTRSNVEEVDRLIAQAKRNADVVRVVLFLTRQNLLTGTDPDRPDWKSLRHRVESGFGMEFCAYLGRTVQDGASWMTGVIVYAGGRVLGSVDGDVYRYVNEGNRLREGRYLYVSNRKTDMGLRFGLMNRSIRRVAWRWLVGGRWGNLSHQAIFLLRTPEKTSDGWDCCDGCPDVMLHDGKLVPSCLLEAIKQGQSVNIERAVGSFPFANRRAPNAPQKPE